MAAVLAPEERPRFEKTLQDMTVSLTSSCELTSVYKVTSHHVPDLFGGAEHVDRQSCGPSRLI